MNLIIVNFIAESSYILEYIYCGYLLLYLWASEFFDSDLSHNA